MSTPDNYTLSVEPQDRIAEIAVYDGNLNVVAKGAGTLKEKVPAGLYRVRIRVGSATDEKLVALESDQTVNFGPVSFLSPIPLSDTEKTHEYHMAAAADAASRIAPKALGTGSSIMVFAREWSAQQNLSEGNPAEGLSLLDANENLLAEIWKEADLRNEHDASAGWRANVNPGGYFLRLKLGDADNTMLLRPIFVSPGHQLQIFCLVSDHIVEAEAQGADQEGRTRSTIRRADLANGAIAISPAGSFDPNDRRIRLSELGCNALAQSREGMSDSLIDELVMQKFENPMLGLFAAHLLLRDKPGDRELFRTVTDHLLRMLGPDHPDLQALWWQRGDDKKIGDGRLRVLPMLRASWNLAVDRSLKTLDVFALGTFYNKLPRIVPSASWMILMDNEWAVSDETIDEYMKARAKARISRTEAISALRAEAFRKQYFKRAYSAVRDILPNSFSVLLPDLAPEVATTKATPPGATPPGAGGLESANALPGSAEPPLQAVEKADLARSLAIPVDVLDSILKRKGHEL
jgi:hypothetical protein